MSRKLFVLLVMAAAIGPPSATLLSDAQLPNQGPRPTLVQGTLIGEKTLAPLAGRLLMFVATTNRCPDTCSCGTGECSGDPSTCKGLCVYGVIARTNKEGVFGIRLAVNTYELYLEGSPSRKPLLAPLVVDSAGKEIKLGQLKAPEQIVGAAQFFR